MPPETLDLTELGKYLQRDSRELEKLVSQGRIPGRRVGGDWIFNRTEINEWLEQQLSSYSDSELETVERSVRGQNANKTLNLLVTPLMHEETMAIPLQARTTPKVLTQLVAVANGTWQVYVPEDVLAAVRAREELCTTALPGGVAIPHPRRPLPHAIGESVIAYGRTFTGIPFGGPRGQLTDLFFLVLCQEERRHLQILARLSRMFQRPDFLDQLRSLDSPKETLEYIRTVEESVLE
jgi:PTS system nitrogen regulatory IIA component